jgi:hypothetical protein
MADETLLEEWRPVEGWPAYAVSNLGRVKRVLAASETQPGKILTQILNQAGYPCVMLSFKSKVKNHGVHVLVCRATVSHIIMGATWGWLEELPVQSEDLHSILP